MPDFTLTVIHPFGDYARGARIVDDEAIEEILAGENAGHVVKVVSPSE